MRTLFISFIIVFCISCSSDVENADIETKDGVKMIHNKFPLWQDNPRVSLKFVQKIGELESEDANYMLYRPADVARDGAGNIYVLDQGNCRVQKFNSEGKFIQTFGRKGQGPGEISQAFCLNLIDDSELFLCDFGNQRIQKFTLDGKEKTPVLIKNRFNAFRILSSGEYVTQFMPVLVPNKDISRQSVLKILDENFSPVREIGQGRFKDFGEYRLTAILNYTGFETDSEDNVYIVYFYQNRLEKFTSSGKQVFQSDRPLEININDSPKTLNDRMLVTVSMAIDSRNRIWLSTSIREGESQNTEGDTESNTGRDYVILEIYNSDGILLGKIPQPVMNTESPIEPISSRALGNIRIFGDRIYFIDAFREMCVYEYKIVESD